MTDASTRSATAAGAAGTVTPRISASTVSHVRTSATAGSPGTSSWCAVLDVYSILVEVRVKASPTEGARCAPIRLMIPLRSLFQSYNKTCADDNRERAHSEQNKLLSIPESCRPFYSYVDGFLCSGNGEPFWHSLAHSGSACLELSLTSSTGTKLPLARDNQYPAEHGRPRCDNVFLQPRRPRRHSPLTCKGASTVPSCIPE